jgi:indole-3-glycerol phosphate synthase
VAIRSLVQLLDAARKSSRPAFVVDLKRRSPRDGELIPEEHFDSYVRAVVESGVEALSMPTDAVHFGGSIELGRRVRAMCDLPLLRKEFFTSVEQIDESRRAGFDAVQLSLSTIPDLGLLRRMWRRAERIGVEVVLGVHGPAQLRVALRLGASVIGLNNRDIAALELDEGSVAGGAALLATVPERLLVISESGMHSASDVASASCAGADALMIGTAVAKSTDPPALLRELRDATLRCGTGPGAR